jgi:hypothetical protein
MPLLWVFGDLAKPQRGESPYVSPQGNDLRHRVLGATFPVVDLVFDGGALRIAGNALPWRGMSHASMSSPLNLVDLIERLSRASGGALIDLRFEGQARPAHADGPPVEQGADSGRWHDFNTYVADLGARFASGALGHCSPGQLALVGAATVSGGGKGGLPAGPAVPVAAPPAMRSGIPWQAKWKSPHVPWPVFPFLLFGLFGLFAFAKAPDHRLIFWPLGCGILALASGLRALLTLQRVLAVPQAKVRSMAMGPVELGGVVHSGVAFPSPQSGMICAWLRWVIEERRRDSRGNQYWDTVDRGEMTQTPFRLDDGTGTVLVQPAGAEVEVDPVVTALGPDRRAREWAILEGATVFVYGMAQRRDHTDERRALLQDALRASKHDARLRASLGLPPEGDLSMEQWDRIHAAVQSSFEDRVRQSDSQPDEVFVGTSPTVSLLISQLSRQSELTRLRLRLWGGVLGGGTLLLVSILTGLQLTGGVR